jgi:hypothetical protein
MRVNGMGLLMPPRRPGTVARDQGTRQPVMFGGQSESLRQQKQAVLQQFNQPLLSPAHLDTWLKQFKPKDRGTALKLVQQLDFYGPADLPRSLRGLHDKVMCALTRDGFVTNTGKELRFDKVDFSKAFSAKSGAIISTRYRHANGLREASFRDVAELAHNGVPKGDRALVILDDYIASGSQFLEDAYATGRHQFMNELLPQYKKIYFAVVVAHEDAVKRFDMLKQGQHQAIVDEVLGDWDVEQPEEHRQRFKRSIEAVSGGKLELLPLSEEVPFLSPRNTRLTGEEKEQMKDFLQRNNVYKRPFGIGNKQGHTVFYYNPPNTLPDILWNSKSRKLDARGQQTTEPFIPLIKRHEDVSVGGHAHLYTPEKQVW